MTIAPAGAINYMLLSLKKTSKTKMANNNDINEANDT